MKSIAIFTLVFAIGSSLTVLAAPKTAKKSEIFLWSYSVVDLPVYRTSAKGAADFDPDLLVKHLRATIDPQSWENGALIKVDDAHRSLVIGQNRANHQAIRASLSAIRGEHPGEVQEVLGVFPGEESE